MTKHLPEARLMARFWTRFWAIATGPHARMFTTILFLLSTIITFLVVIATSK